MANELALEDINVADFMAQEKVVVAMQKMEEVAETDPEVGALVKAAQTVEDVYEIVKRCANATLEQVKVIFQKTMDYFQAPKVALADEVLDNVSGGGLLSWWNEHKSKVIFGVVAVGCVVLGAAIGAATFGLGGCLIGLGAGAVVGLIAGMAAGKAVE